jgi:predicted dehydrogenase
MTQLAIVGAAHIHTPGFIKRIQERNDVTVSHVWDHDHERAAKNAALLGAEVAADLTDIWTNQAIEAAVILSETNRHESLVVMGAAAGKHLFVEKPLGIAGEDAARMADAIEQAGVYFNTGFFMRGQPVNLFLKEQIAAGHFGKITRVRHSNCHAGSLKGWFDGEWRWMADPALAGVGAFGDLGAHSLDILMWLFGDVAAVTATVDVATARYGDCDEFGEAMIRFENGVLGTLAAGWVDVANPVTCIISGTEGHAAVVNDHLYYTSQHVEGADGVSAWTLLPVMGKHPLDQFLDAVQVNDASGLITAREAAARSRVMAAMYRAAAQSDWVAI